MMLEQLWLRWTESSLLGQSDCDGRWRKVEVYGSMLWADTKLVRQ